MEILRLNWLYIDTSASELKRQIALGATLHICICLVQWLSCNFLIYWIINYIYSVELPFSWSECLKQYHCFWSTTVCGLWEKLEQFCVILSEYGIKHWSVLGRLIIRHPGQLYIIELTKLIQVTLIFVQNIIVDGT